MQVLLTEKEYNDLKELADKAENYEKLYNKLMSQHMALKVKYQELTEKYDVTLEDKIQNILFEEFKKTLIPDLELHKAILNGVPIQRCLKSNSKLILDPGPNRIPFPLMYETYDIANSEDQFLDYDNYDYRLTPDHNEGYLKQVDCSLYNTN